MPDVTVPVLKPLDYQGRSYVRGESVTMRAVDALAASRAGQVSLTKQAKGYATTALIAKPTSDPAPTDRRRRRGRGKYQRRDMRAGVTKPTE